MSARLAVFTKNRTNPAYAAARLGAERAAARHGATVVHYVPERPDDIDQQIALIDAALAMRPDAFVFNPAHESAVNAAVQRVFAAGVPLAGFINPLTIPGALTFVGCDDRALAVAVARRLLDRLGGRGRMLVMEGVAGALTSAERTRGFLDAIAAAPGIELVGRIRGDYQRPDAARAMRDWLDAGGRADGVLSSNDMMSLGILDVFAERGLDWPLTGVNALPEAVAEIRAGRLLATADFDALKLAYVATEAVLRHLAGEPVPREIRLPFEVVDRDNCARWDLPHEARPDPVWRDIVPASSRHGLR